MGSGTWSGNSYENYTSSQNYDTKTIAVRNTIVNSANKSQSVVNI